MYMSGRQRSGENRLRAPLNIEDFVCKSTCDHWRIEKNSIFKPSLGCWQMIEQSLLQFFFKDMAACSNEGVLGVLISKIP